MGNKRKRLSKEKWEEIRLLLLKPDRNVTKIAKKYKINRHTIYEYAWRRNWLERKRLEPPRKEPKRSFWAVFWESLLGKPHVSDSNKRK